MKINVQYIIGPKFRCKHPKCLGDNRRRKKLNKVEFRDDILDTTAEPPSMKQTMDILKISLENQCQLIFNSERKPQTKVMFSKDTPDKTLSSIT